MTKKSSENRKIRRHLLTLSKKGRLRKGETENYYVDNKNIEYPYKWEARLSSFYNVIMGCFKNGFPVVVPKLWYVAWAFYPFFFIRKDLKVEDPIPILNHERIHIRQQRDIHLLVSVPILIACMLSEWFGWFNVIPVIISVPFVPTFFYGLEMIRSFINRGMSGTFNDVRENTCFEREAISRSTNAEYLFHRKFWAVLAYTGWKRFQNYGIE